MAATRPSATPEPPAKSGLGCLAIALLVPVVIVVGFLVGAVLNRQDDPNGEKAVTLDEGSLAGSAWRVDAERDVEGAICAFLYSDDEQLAGACTLTPEDATFGTQTVVFGRAASTEGSVSVLLDDERVVEIPTQTAEGIDGRFFVEVVAGDVDAEGFAP